MKTLDFLTDCVARLAYAKPLAGSILILGASQIVWAQDPQEALDAGVLLDKYCTECHNLNDYSGGIDLEGIGAHNIAEYPQMAEAVIERLRAGLMPPRGEPRPDFEVQRQLAVSLEQAIDAEAAREVAYLPAPGLHRLNRNEYSNVIRDLLGLRIDATAFLPPDDSSHGFDNMAGTLTTSPALIEAYLTAAGRISRLAIGSDTSPTLVAFDVPVDTSQNTHVQGLPFGTRGGMLIEHEFPADGEYVLTVKGMTGYFTRVLGNVAGEQLEVTIDGERVYLFDWDEEIGNMRSDGGRTPPIPIKAGFHRVGVTFIATTDLPDTGLNKSFVRTMNSPGAIAGYTFYPHVGQVFIEGPHNGKPATDTPSRRQIFECYPQQVSQETACAQQIITTLASKAFRRPANEADLDIMMRFFRAGREEGGNFDAGIEAAIQRLLTDPEFIYRAEVEPKDSIATGTPYQISDMALASRLSFFLWSSIPDNELIELADQGRLHNDEVLREQLQRMIADPRAEAFVENFVGQWLSVRGISASEPVVGLFPDFDSTLRQAFRREIELYFSSIMEEDRSVLDLLTAEHTFVNERLAKHYGIDGVYGSQFRRVTLGPEQSMRHGLLGKGALLTITSDAARTSPIKRGKWFLETFLGVTPPDPPPGVETNLMPHEGEAPTTLRARLEAHSTNPSCATCHMMFEPMGLAMENFDAVGRWRTLDSGLPIDATATIPDGTYLTGVQDLRAVTVRYGEQFAQVMTEKLLTYAIGRGLEYQDMPTLRSITHKAAEDDYRFTSLLMAVIRSPAFTKNLTTAVREE